jgi:hypothetical protein
MAEKLNQLTKEEAEKRLREAGFPAGSAGIAQSGWSGNTEATPEGLKKLLEDAVAEAEAQQQQQQGK